MREIIYGRLAIPTVFLIALGQTTTILSILGIHLTGYDDLTPITPFVIWGSLPHVLLLFGWRLTIRSRYAQRLFLYLATLTTALSAIPLAHFYWQLPFSPFDLSLREMIVFLPYLQTTFILAAVLWLIFLRLRLRWHRPKPHFMS